MPLGTCPICGKTYADLVSHAREAHPSYGGAREILMANRGAEAQSTQDREKPLPAINEDIVNHPSHYTFGKYEVIDVLLDWFSTEPLLWQVGKYIARALHKGKCLEDLKKARFYLDKRIQIEEKRAKDASGES